MFAKNTLVLYKKQPAIITEVGEKYTIEYQSVPATNTGKKAQYATQKVRDKDISELFPNAKVSLESIINQNTNSAVKEGFFKALEEAYELLLSDEETASSTFDFATLIEYSIGELTDLNSFVFFDSVINDIHFKYDENTKLFSLRTEDEIKQIQQKNYEKEHEAEIKEAFINRLKQKKINLPDDTKFMQEIEALALGKTDKSKFLKEAGIKETPEKAHKILLDTGFWHMGKNPYPSRYGASMQSATENLASPPVEERIVVNHTAYAIDNIWSTDPDDAIGFDGEYVWVHIADPASSVLPDSKIDIKARNRGATLYIPEGASRMLAEESIEDYALGLCEYSDGCKTGKLS
ncbi:MAG: RNB domain-containing ribonuclease, partial [Spirochaetaceae bacterium]|nr:RNB domain-containing ribonuclease [Spirochaetaceae bacterium]